MPQRKKSNCHFCGSNAPAHYRGGFSGEMDVSDDVRTDFGEDFRLD